MVDGYNAAANLGTIQVVHCQVCAALVFICQESEATRFAVVLVPVWLLASALVAI